MVAAYREERAVEYARETLRGETPPAVGWIEHLSRSHLVQFAVELSEAVREWGVTNDRGPLIELLASWEATAAIDADHEVAEALLKPREMKDYVDWPLKG
jgi:hypothetical protein